MTIRSTLVLLLRVGISAGLLVFLFWRIDVDFGALWPDDATAVIWLVLAFVCMFGSMWLASMRWQQVCRAIGIAVPSWRLFVHTAAGQFVSNFVPTTIGGDVLRVTRLGSDTNDRPNSFVSVVFERLSGWMVLPACIFAGLILDPGLWKLGAATRGALVAAIVTLVALAVILFAAGNDLSGRLLDRYEGPLRWLHAVHEGLDIMRGQLRQVGRILGTGFLYQVILVGAFWCAAQSIGIEGFGVRAALAFVPAVLIVQVLPLGIGGLGVREAALLLFLSSLDIPDEQAVALGLTVYGLTVLMSVVGIPSLAFGGSSGEDEVDDSDVVPVATKESPGRW